MAGKYDEYEKILYGNKSSGTSQLAKNQKTINNYSARLAAGGVNPEQASDDRNFLEKALNLTPNQNALFDLFEILNRPQEALFGGIESLQKGEDFLEGAKEGITGNKRTQFKDILMNTGLFDDTTYEDLVKSGEKEGLATRLKAMDLVDLLGFGGDVFLDPTNVPIVPGLKSGGKLASVDDLVGIGAKKAIKGTTSFADDLIEKGLAKADELKGVTDNAGNVVKLGYANKAADSAADLQKYVRNAGDLVGTGANVPMGRLESYKNIKNSISDMFKVPDSAKNAILKGREADAAAEGFRKQVGVELGNARKSVDEAAAKIGMKSDDLGKDLMLFAESKADRSMKMKDILKLGRDGTLDYTDESIKALNNLLEDVPKDIVDSGDFTIKATKNGKIKLGSSWNKKVLAEQGLEFDPNKLDSLFDLGTHYGEEATKDIERVNKLYETNKDFKKIADEIVGDVWNGGTNEGLVNRLNKMVDEGGFSTDLVNTYNKTNQGYVPHIQNFTWDEIKDYSNIPEGLTKGNTGLLVERRLTGSAREINDMWKENLTKNYDTLSDAAKKFVDSHDKLFEDNLLNAVENRYFGQLPGTLKQNKIVNDVLINQTFGNVDEIKKLQSDIHKFSRLGDKENLKKATEAYNKLTDSSTVKFLTDYDKKVPMGYKQLSTKELDQIINKFDTMGKQLGNQDELNKVLKTIKKQKGNIAIDENVLRMMQVTVDEKQMNAFGQIYNKWLNSFKKWKTASPSFLMNNLVGNSSNMYLSGIDLTEQARYGSKVADIITNGEKYSNMLLTGQKLTDAQRDIAKLWDTANEIGIMGRKGNLTALNVQDMPESVLRYFRDGTKPVGKEWLKDAIPYFNNLANQKMDAAARLTVMMKAIDDPSYIANLGIKATGKTGVRDAVAKVMFDPDMMTKFEREKMKKIIPFYTYAKNNLVYHLDNMGQNLGRYQRVMKGVKSLQEAATGGNSEDMADYLKNSLYIPIPGLGKDGKYTILRANLPFGQLLELADNPLQELVNMTTPLIKTPYEVATNRSVFTGRDIESFPGQKGKLGIPFTDIKLSKKAETLLSGLSGFDVPLKTLNRLYEGYSSEDPLGGIRNAFTMTNSVDTDRLNRSYEQIQDLQNLMKQYQQQGYEFSTINELKKANKNGTIENINAILNKYGIQ